MCHTFMSILMCMIPYYIAVGMYNYPTLFVYQVSDCLTLNCKVRHNKVTYNSTNVTKYKCIDQV